MSVFYYDIEGDIIDEYNNIITFFDPLAMAMDIVSYIRTLSSTYNHSVVVNEKIKMKHVFASICHIAYFFAKIVVKSL